MTQQAASLVTPPALWNLGEASRCRPWSLGGAAWSIDEGPCQYPVNGLAGGRYLLNTHGSGQQGQSDGRWRAEEAVGGP